MMIFICLLIALVLYLAGFGLLFRLIGVLAVRGLLYVNFLRLFDMRRRRLLLFRVWGANVLFLLVFLGFFFSRSSVCFVSGVLALLPVNVDALLFWFFALRLLRGLLWRGRTVSVQLLIHFHRVRDCVLLILALLLLRFIALFFLFRFLGN